MTDTETKDTQAMYVTVGGIRFPDNAWFALDANALETWAELVTSEPERVADFIRRLAQARRAELLRLAPATGPSDPQEDSADAR